MELYLKYLKNKYNKFESIKNIWSEYENLRFDDAEDLLKKFFNINDKIIYNIYWQFYLKGSIMALIRIIQYEELIDEDFKKLELEVYKFCAEMELKQDEKFKYKSTYGIYYYALLLTSSKCSTLEELIESKNLIRGIKLMEESKKRGNIIAEKHLFFLYKKIGNFTKFLEINPDYYKSKSFMSVVEIVEIIFQDIEYTDGIIKFEPYDEKKTIKYNRYQLPIEYKKTIQLLSSIDSKLTYIYEISDILIKDYKNMNIWKYFCFFKSPKFLFGIAKWLCINTDEIFFRYGLFLLNFLIKKYDSEEAKNLFNYLNLKKKLIKY